MGKYIKFNNEQFISVSRKRSRQITISKYSEEQYLVILQSTEIVKLSDNSHRRYSVVEIEAEIQRIYHPSSEQLLEEERLDSLGGFYS